VYKTPEYGQKEGDQLGNSQDRNLGRTPAVAWSIQSVGRDTKCFGLGYILKEEVIDLVKDFKREVCRGGNT
jgi:hypothetical protein